MRYITKKDIVLKIRDQDSHKGDNGRVLVVAGSEMYAGAAALAAAAAMAVLRAGADLSILAAPSKVAWAASAMYPDIIGMKLSGAHLALKHAEELEEQASQADVIVIGNGIGLHGDTKDFVNKFIPKYSRNLVIDADAIKLISKDNFGKLKNSVITPHAKELEILSRNIFKKHPKTLPAIQKTYRGFLEDNVLLLKGHIDKILFHDMVAYNKTGDPGMSKGGTGDVLAGVVGGLMGAGNSAFISAKAAAYITGKAGEMLGEIDGYSYVASEMIDILPLIMKEFPR